MSTSNSPVDDKQTFDNEPKTFKEALRLLREEAKAKGLDNLTMEEIDQEIADYRREKREKELAG
jgi:hypothetical protein